MAPPPALRPAADHETTPMCTLSVRRPGTATCKREEPHTGFCEAGFLIGAGRGGAVTSDLCISGLVTEQSDTDERRSSGADGRGRGLGGRVLHSQHGAPTDTQTALSQHFSTQLPQHYSRMDDTLCMLAGTVHHSCISCTLLSYHTLTQSRSCDCSAITDRTKRALHQGGGSVAIDEYLEYRRIVGDDDGGRLFTPEEYEDYKRKVLPTRQRNRLYVSCGVPGGIDCKLIGPETPCFCSHRYKQHKTDFEEIPAERPLALPCRVPGCRCATYLYVHLSGSQPVRCRCKHPCQDHSEAPGHLCRKCSTCTGFRSPYTCGCGQPGYAHETLVETREERQARDRPVGQDVPYTAMGGLTGFSSLADGYLRLDPSGIGAHMPTALSSRFEEGCSLQSRTSGADSSSSAECVTDLRTREEQDMAYFERRYQDRLKMEKLAKQKATSSKAKTQSDRSNRK
ncbi:hypothetical protein SKAU_G00147950 [Synaphobranchus kaupii]|uniref:Protein FAM221A n=1 Tax=Synaphobranchus kaupii TaxID=118154 RepID=A0A9Q1FTZ2_SYNKA|nr:hypothetical protein SKAU_G00147950 [Synaphobranchus kaupii]